MSRLTLPNVGRITICEAMKANTFALALGLGDAVWANPPDVDPAATGLVDPVAMVRASIKEFVTPDSAGAIEFSDGSKWSLSPTPTKYLYLSFVLQFADAPVLTLRERAVHIGPTFDGGVGPGQTFIDWDDVTSPGDLLAMTNFAPLPRAGTRQTFREILTF